MHLCCCILCITIIFNPPNSPAGRLRICTWENAAQQARPVQGPDPRASSSPHHAHSFPRKASPRTCCALLDMPLNMATFSWWFSFWPSLNWCMGQLPKHPEVPTPLPLSHRMAERSWYDPSRKLPPREGNLTVAITRTHRAPSDTAMPLQELALEDTWIYRGALA